MLTRNKMSLVQFYRSFKYKAKNLRDCAQELVSSIENRLDDNNIKQDISLEYILQQVEEECFLRESCKFYSLTTYSEFCSYNINALKYIHHSHRSHRSQLYNASYTSRQILPEKDYSDLLKDSISYEDRWVYNFKLNKTNIGD